MKTIAGSALVLCATVYLVASAAAQTPVGALAIDERQGDQYGWAVDYETTGAARQRALSECGSGCSVVLTFERCAAYAADQGAGSTVYGWAESYDSVAGARQRALAECGSRGSGCTVRVWGCNGHVVEESLGLDRAARRQVQEGLQAAGFDPGGADGMFGPRTRTAIRSWQTSRGARGTGYLDGASSAALRPSVAGQPTFREREPAGVAAASATAPAALAGVSAPQPPPASAELESLFWQSIMNSTSPADFEAYLSQFPNGVFRVLAQNRLSALRGPVGSPAVAGADGAPATGTRGSGIPVAGVGIAAGVDTRPRAGTVFRPDQTCAGQAAGTSCWMEISEQPGCYVWNAGYALGATVTWTGECSGGLTQGTGSLTWVWDDNEQVATGRLQDGEQTGDWVIRYADGTVQEGPYVDGARTGHWVLRFADGNVEEGPAVDGARTGHWVIRDANGTVGEGPAVDGARTGHWVIRYANGNVHEGPLVDGARTGDWVIRYANGTVHEGPYVDGARTGHWVIRYANGNVHEGPLVDGARTGHWVIRYVNGTVGEGPYVDGERTGHWVFRDANGTVGEGPYVDGAQTGHWVFRFADGTVEEGPVVDGARTGDWVHRSADGTVKVGRYENDELVEIR